MFRRHQNPAAPAAAPQSSAESPDTASLRRWFAKVDTDGSGYISPTELQAALEEGGLRFSLSTVAAIIRYGYELEPAVQRALFKRFDPLSTGSMGLQEFLALIIFLRSSATTFKAFDPAATGVVHLNFQQFLYAVVNSS
ncbi:hypothetical protein GPECTOR_2g1449 [Gonium pectorale]|uniref:EF-hand domain-containing protein n=1 Tax=Gonium pectorale TaxID=33097 RepID=A0A150H234_GONPE|nr:hypothetical protein GPECTOR_2g1449 [Gonium pectorale]|eukprot:KXZ55898.1 hypothetical protein GPECTOR_2g1449 [Gonium pectorale]